MRLVEESWKIVAKALDLSMPLRNVEFSNIIGKFVCRECNARDKVEYDIQHRAWCATGRWYDGRRELESLRKEGIVER